MNVVTRQANTKWKQINSTKYFYVAQSTPTPSMTYSKNDSLFNYCGNVSIDVANCFASSLDLLDSNALDLPLMRWINLLWHTLSSSYLDSFQCFKINILLKMTSSSFRIFLVFLLSKTEILTLKEHLVFLLLKMEVLPLEQHQ